MGGHLAQLLCIIGLIKRRLSAELLVPMSSISQDQLAVDLPMSRRFRCCLDSAVTTLNGLSSTAKEQTDTSSSVTVANILRSESNCDSVETCSCLRIQSNLHAVYWQPNTFSEWHNENALLSLPHAELSVQHAVLSARHIRRGGTVQSAVYNVSQKNDTDVAHYNFNAYQPILIIFGLDAAERICYRTVIWYSAYPN